MLLPQRAQLLSIHLAAKIDSGPVPTGKVVAYVMFEAVNVLTDAHPDIRSDEGQVQSLIPASEMIKRLQHKVAPLWGIKSTDKKNSVSVTYIQIPSITKA